MIFKELAMGPPPAGGQGWPAQRYSGAGPFRLVFGPGEAGRGGHLRGDSLGPVPCRLMGNAANIPLGRDCVDEICLAHALETLPRSLLARALRECRRVLKPGGRLVVRGLDVDRAIGAARHGQLDGEELSHLMAAAGSSQVRSLSWFTEGRALQLLLDAGLESVRPIEPGGPSDPVQPGPGEAAAFSQRRPGGAATFDWLIECRKPLMRRKSITISGWGHLCSLYFVIYEFLMGFDRRGYDTSFDAIIPADFVIDMVRKDPLVRELAEKPPSGDVWLNAIGNYPPEPRDLVVSTIPADSTRMNANVIDELNRKSHLVITFCELSRELLVDSGVDIPIHVLPLGIDPGIFNAEGPAHDFDLPPGTFVFFICAHFQARKGLDILLPAFVEEFCHGEAVALVIKESEACPGTGEFIERIIDDARLRVSQPPLVKLIAEPTTQATLASMQRSADCFVWASRLEGFGLPPLEALACGTPVIAPAYGGQMEYLDDDVAHLYPIKGFDRMPPEYRDFWLLDPAGQWACPDPDGLREAMRRAFEDRDGLAEMGQNGLLRARDYAWPQVVDRYVDLVEANLP